LLAVLQTLKFVNDGVSFEVVALATFARFEANISGSKS
jgi:hypothetical protein